MGSEMCIRDSNHSLFTVRQPFSRSSGKLYWSTCQPTVLFDLRHILSARIDGVSLGSQYRSDSSYIICYDDARINASRAYDDSSPYLRHDNVYSRVGGG